MPDVLLYRCDPLLAWISPEQCDVNHERAVNAHRELRGHPPKERLADRIQLAPCIGCPGVVSLARLPMAQEPRLVGAELEARKNLQNSP